MTWEPCEKNTKTVDSATTLSPPQITGTHSACASILKFCECEVLPLCSGSTGDFNLFFVFICIFQMFYHAHVPLFKSENI